MDRHEYLLDENWYGSFYEISLELGPVGNDVLAMQALRALWSQPEVRGPWRERSDFDSEPDDAAIEISISYPLDTATNPWMVEFDERLARIGAAIYGMAPFRLGLIGESVQVLTRQLERLVRAHALLFTSLHPC